MTTQRPLRILLVEDDNMIAHVIAIAMQDLGVPYQLGQAFSAEEAFELWSEQPYDLLLTDYNLRGINGLSLIASLRRQNPSVPTVLFTAYDINQLRKDPRAADVTRFVAKPFVIDDFIGLTRDLLTLRANSVGMRAVNPAHT